MGNLRAQLAGDVAYRQQKKARDARLPEILARNKCIQALAELPDPAQALAVIRAVERSILEHIAAQASGML